MLTVGEAEKQRIYRATDYDWVCAESPEQAQGFMLTLADYTIDEVPLDGIRELSEKEMLAHYFIEDDGTRRSFHDKHLEFKAKDTHAPFYFACTDW